MVGFKIELLWILAFIFVISFSSFIYAKEDECAIWNGAGGDFKTDCSNCKSHKTSDNTTCVFFVAKGHQDKGFCVSESHNNELKGFSQAFDCSWFIYPPSTSIKTPQPTFANSDVKDDSKTPEKDFNEGEEYYKTVDFLEYNVNTESMESTSFQSVFLGVFIGFFFGVIFMIALLMIFIYGWNKYQSIRNEIPIKY